MNIWVFLETAQAFFMCRRIIILRNAIMINSMKRCEHSLQIINNYPLSRLINSMINNAQSC